MGYISENPKLDSAKFNPSLTQVQPKFNPSLKCGLRKGIYSVRCFKSAWGTLVKIEKLEQSNIAKKQIAKKLLLGYGGLGYHVLLNNLTTHFFIVVREFHKVVDFGEEVVRNVGWVPRVLVEWAPAYNFSP